MNIKAILLFPVRLLLRLIIFAIQVGIMAGVAFFVIYTLQTTGIVGVNVPVSGGSMLPTLPEQGYVSFQRYAYFPSLPNFFKPKLERGDLVVFRNAKTAKELEKQHKTGAGFVKRVLGIAGDRIAIRDGFVYRNNSLVPEPYTLKPRSTFGGTAVQDCQEVVVPQDSLFVLGDNRKISLDSRQVGIINASDVQYYLPYDKQEKEFGDKWRDPKDDTKAKQSSLFSTTSYLNLLNKEREKSGLAPLKYQPKLEESAKKRAEMMLESDDLSFEATQSGYTMQKALNEVGYSNIIYGEFPILGYYDAQELIDAFFEQKNARDFLLNKDYQEIGVSTFVGSIHGCPAQVVVQHLAGYVPPDYKPADIRGWELALNRLRDVQPSWQKLRESGEYYDRNKARIDRINDIITLRLSRLEKIVSRLQANEWLTEEEKVFMREDSALYDEQNKIADELNDSL